MHSKPNIAQSVYLLRNGDTDNVHSLVSTHGSDSIVSIHLSGIEDQAAT